MSKQVNIKNQNKLKVYLAKEKKNDTQSNCRGTNKDRKPTRTN